MYNREDIIKAPIFAISRLRMGTDGSGITTLVTFMGCPLQCKYCLNKKCHEPIYESDGKTLRKGIMMLTPQELYDMVTDRPLRLTILRLNDQHPLFCQARAGRRLSFYARTA